MWIDGAKKGLGVFSNINLKVRGELEDTQKEREISLWVLQQVPLSLAGIFRQ